MAVISAVERSASKKSPRPRPPEATARTPTAAAPDGGPLGGREPAEVDAAHDQQKDADRRPHGARPRQPLAPADALGPRRRAGGDERVDLDDRDVAERGQHARNGGGEEGRRWIARCRSRRSPGSPTAGSGCRACRRPPASPSSGRRNSHPRRISGSATFVMVATVASDEPQIAPKAAQPRMVATPSPPRRCPTNARAARNSAADMPPLVASSPISRKNGMTHRV